VFVVMKSPFPRRSGMFNYKRAALALTLLMIVSTTILLPNFTKNIASAQGTVVSSSANDSGLLQYEWPQFTGDSSFTRFSAGPAPESADVLWKANITGIRSYVSAFNGKVYVTTKTDVYALNRTSGEVIWSSVVPSPGPWPSVYKIDGTHMVVGSSCFDPDNGTLLWTSSDFASTPEPLFSANVYSPEERMFYVKDNSYVYAWNFSDPSVPPTLAWQTFVPGSGSQGSGVQYGGGKVFPGTYDPTQIAIDAKTGKILWSTNVKGSMLFSGSYYEGKFIRAGSHDNTIYCFNATDGKVLWTFNPQTEGGYFTIAPAVAYGIVYELNKDGNLYALDVNSGNFIWKYQGPGPMIFPGNPTVADGKVYATTGQTAGYHGESGASEFACLDAFTGAVVWKMPIEAFAPRESVAVAYGNMYLIPANVTTAVDSISSDEYQTINQVWALGSVSWSMFLHDAAHSSVGQSGPSNLALRWKFTTGGAVVSSPTVANDVVYVGSMDKNIYALNARSGTLIWSFTTLDRIESTPAVADGKVYTGGDDGYVYCLDAANGSLLWRTFVNGDIPVSFAASLNLRSSPCVADGKVYVGSLDTNLYCLDARDGNVSWTFKTRGPISSSPAVVDGYVYVKSQEPTVGALYKVSAIDGTVVWKRDLPYQIIYQGGTDLHGSASVADGMVFTSSNMKEYYGINSTTGEIIWTFRDNNAVEFILSTPIYENGRLFLIDKYSIACINAKTGQTIWSSYTGEELYVSPIYADGKLYVVTDERSIFTLNATNGDKLGHFAMGSNSWCSPTVYEGRLYAGDNDWNVYCLADFSYLRSSLLLGTDKNYTALGESVVLIGQLIPKIPGTSINLIVVNPHGGIESTVVQTGNRGFFAHTYTPTMTGKYSITAEWNPSWGYYRLTSSDSETLEIIANPTPTTPSATPTTSPIEGPFGMPLGYFYAIAAVLAVAIIGVSIIFYAKHLKMGE
jgi:eukaryotic-like serine/threonine-protein kinase